MSLAECLYPSLITAPLGQGLLHASGSHWAPVTFSIKSRDGNSFLLLLVHLNSTPFKLSHMKQMGWILFPAQTLTELTT